MLTHPDNRAKNGISKNNFFIMTIIYSRKCDISNFFLLFAVDFADKKHYIVNVAKRIEFFRFFRGVEMGFVWIVTVTGAILLFSSLSSRLSNRLNLPILLLFLGFGMMLRWIFPRESISAHEINYLGTIAMSFILFSGGLNTRYSAVKKVFLSGALLATLGVIITGLVLGVGAWLIFKISWVKGEYNLLWCLLLGAIISSTDASSVFAILRGKGIGLKGKLRDLLEFESGSNDPMAYCLTTIMLALVMGKELSIAGALWLLIFSMLIGVVAGWLFGHIGRWLFHFEMEYEGLYFVFIVSVVLISYGATELCRGNGMMACYVAGVTMNYLKFNYQRSVSRFCDGMTWLLQVTLFVSLGFVAGGRNLFAPQVLIPGILLSLLLMLIARPAAVFATLAFRRISIREKALVSWVGLRGAAPIVLATFPLAENMPGSEVLFNMIFFMVLISIALQGATLMPAAELIGVARPADSKDRLPLELEITDASSDQDMFEFLVPDQAEIVGKSLAQIAFPEGALVTMIRRGKSLVSPRGGTVIEPGDGLLIMAKKDIMKILARDFFPNSGY